MPQQPPTKNKKQDSLLILPETRTEVTKNPWLASFLLRQVRRVCELQHQLRLYAYWLWVRGQTGGALAYHRLRAMRPGKRLVRSTVTGAALLLASAAPVLAGTITVNSATDDGTGCTLREAIVAANTDAAYGGCSGAAGHDVIDLTNISGTVTLTGTLPVITETVQLNGPGADNLIIDGGSTFNALEGTKAGTSIGVDALTVTNVTGHGIYATDSLTVTNSIITGSECGAYAYEGSAVISSSTITGQGCNGVNAYSGATITDSLVTGAYYGVYVFYGPATVTDSTVTGNDYGMLSFGDALVTNSVITGTTDNGVDSYANVMVISSTVTGGYNGVYSATGNIVIDSSTITGIDDGVDANVGYAHVSNSKVVGGEAGVDTDTGAVVVSSSTIFGTTDPGIDAVGSATVISSTVTSDSANGVKSNNSISVSYSTITGGGTGVVAAATITIESSTISGSGQHGVQSLTGPITINYSTIVNNAGYGIINTAGNPILHHTIVAQNAQSGTTRDIAKNTLLDTSSSYNFIGNGEYSNISDGSNGNEVGSKDAVLDPLLGSLQDNGGPTATHLPDPDSPVIDAGDPNFSGPPDFDQRGSGFPRIIDTVDIGAVEATDKLIKIRLPIIFKEE